MDSQVVGGGSDQSKALRWWQRPIEGLAVAATRDVRDSSQNKQNLTGSRTERDLRLSSNEVDDEDSSYTIDSEVENELEVSLAEEEITRIRSPWASTSLIGKVHGNIGDDFSYEYFVYELKATWGCFGEIKCVSLSHGFFLITLDSHQDLARVSKHATWFIGDHVVTIRKWEPNFKPSEATLESNPNWIRLPELPIEYYDKLVLQEIANRIGTLLRIDSMTIAGGHHKYARLCVEMDPQKPLPRFIKIGSLKQLIQYEGIDIVCNACGMKIHTVRTSCNSITTEPTLKHPYGHVPTKKKEIPLLAPPALQPCSESTTKTSSEEKQPSLSMRKSMVPLLARQATIKWKYEVFVSFRGEDVRRRFASHIFLALEKADIPHYRDTDQKERGQVVKPMLFEAIHLSKVAVILFSKNYADSRWCLDELVEIMKCHEEYKHRYNHSVFPIFYDVLPGDVRGQKGVFGDGYRKCIEKYGTQEAMEWKNALEQAGNISGWDSENEEESTLIAKIIETICNRVSFACSPYGGDGGDPFDDKYTDIRKLTITVNSSTVESIRIDYDKDGSLFSRRYGCGTREGETFTVKLNYPGEHLISISGHIKGNSINGVIQSLLIQSNQQKYGPYGKQEGRPFSINSKKGEKIVGFFGRSGSHLNSIDAHYAPISSTFNKIGPFGSCGEINWDDGRHRNIREIKVVYGAMVQSIGIVYVNNGHQIGPFIYGKRSPEGRKKESFELAYPDEYVTSISGFMREGSEGFIMLQSLTIHTNLKSHGPFGDEVGKPFSSPGKGIVKIVGFFGRCSSNGDIESIGANVESISDMHSLRTTYPFGCEGGNPWNDGKYNGIRQIVLLSSTCIDSIGFVYEGDTKLVEASRHGGTCNARIDMVNIEPGEYLTGISGYYGKENNCDVIKSLTFKSNKKTHGPYGGNQEGTYFMSPPNYGKIVGFYGSCSSYLVSIGAYFAPILHLYPLKSLGPFGGVVGSSWDDGAHTCIKQIDIRHGAIVNSIECWYIDDGREEPHYERHGGSGGIPTSFKLDYPDEYIVSMTGQCSGVSWTPGRFVSTITFQTNRKTHGPFGKDRGTPFSITADNGKIVGFHGRSDQYISSIGAHIEDFSA